MKRFVYSDGSLESLGTEVPEVDAFLASIGQTCIAYGFSISHEDGFGSFEIVPFNPGDMEWLKRASYYRNN